MWRISHLCKISFDNTGLARLSQHVQGHLWRQTRGQELDSLHGPGERIVIIALKSASLRYKRTLASGMRGYLHEVVTAEL